MSHYKINNDYVCSDNKMVEIFKIAKKASVHTVPILICGETGTGKEVIADFIHSNSPRFDRPFVKVNCAAIPSELMETELFGSVRGSYTSSCRTTFGIIDAADGGTLLLDEVGEMTSQCQSKLLRVLQFGEYMRVGSVQVQRSDCRIIASTNINIRKAIEDRKLRSDLFFRLSVIRLDLPSLKARRGEILRFVDYFLGKYVHFTGVKATITQEARRFLQNCDWPGNVRQLENEIKRALVLSDDPTLDLHHFSDKETIDWHKENPTTLKSTVEKTSPETILVASAETKPVASGEHSEPTLVETSKGTSEETLQETSQEIENDLKLSKMEKIEREAILSELIRCLGNKLLAARNLGIGRQTLYNKIKLYGITDEQIK